MKAVPKSLFKFILIFVVFSVLSLTAAACTSSPEDDNHATNNDHAHEGNEGDDHSHDEGSTTIGGEEAKIDHHGNPVFDEEERVYEQYIQDGVSVEFTVENFLGVGGRGGELAPRIVESEHAVLQFNITSSENGEQLTNLRPAVWLDLAGESMTEEACKAQVQGYLSGNLEARPIVDLNSYFILGMNKDNTISVIDPMVDVAGMTNLFAIILLQGTPEDWAMTGDQLKLFVTMPDLNKIAIIDLDSFQVVANIEVSGRPVHVAIQPDGRYAWVGMDSDKRRESSVAVIDVAGQSLVTEIASGAGTHNFAFSPDSHYAYVTNSDAGTLSIIDTQSLEVVKDLEVGNQPVSVAVAPSSGVIYVADQASGMIYVIDGSLMEPTDGMVAAPGLLNVDISPDGKWGVASNPAAQEIYLFEVQANRMTHVMPVKGEPDQITFTDSAAYVRSNSSPAVFVIPFAEIDPVGNVSLLTVPIGTLPPSSAETTSTASAVFPVPDGKAVLVANPADDKIYFYSEGSQSALGGYQGHTLVPRAVQVVDRSLKERSPGVYTGGIRIPRSGDLMVAILLDDPQLVHCFKFTAKPSDDLASAGSGIKPVMEFLNDDQPKTGQLFSLQVKLTDEVTGEPISEAEDLIVLARVLAGNWNDRVTATNLGDGLYEFQLSFPNPGKYNLFFVVPSLGINFDQLPQRAVQVTAE